MPITYSPSVTCPSACSLRNGNGCYAEGGNTALHWRKLDAKDWGMPWERFLLKASAHLYRGQRWRHNVVGDLMGIDNAIDNQMLAQLVEMNDARKAAGFTYTHKPVGLTGQELVNARAINAVNKHTGFKINLSADTMEEADEKASLGIAPVVVVAPSDAPKHMKTPEGRSVIVCPAEYAEHMNCARCGLCAKERNSIVAFRAHGVFKKHINKRHLTVIAA